MLERNTILRASSAGGSHWIMRECVVPLRNGNPTPVSFISISCWPASETRGGWVMEKGAKALNCDATLHERLRLEREGPCRHRGGNHEYFGYGWHSLALSFL